MNCFTSFTKTDGPDCFAGSQRRTTNERCGLLHFVRKDEFPVEIRHEVLWSKTSSSRAIAKRSRTTNERNVLLRAKPSQRRRAFVPACRQAGAPNFELIRIIRNKICLHER